MAWLPMRQGVADMHRRVEVSRAANFRYLEALALIPQAQPARQILDRVSAPVRTRSRSSRALRPIAPQDAGVFEALLRGEFLLAGFRNRDLRSALFPEKPSTPEEQRRRSSHTTRWLRLLHAHNLVRKISKTRRYLLSKRGVTVMAAALAVRHADLSVFGMTA